MNHLMGTLRKAKGFTIVELLVVIVVIGILASITIVAYNGVTNRANTAARNASAANLAKKIETYNSLQGFYPAFNTIANVTSALNGVTESSLTGSGITLGTPTNTTTNGLVQLRLCTNGTPAAGTASAGFVIYIYDLTLTSAGLNPVQTGGNASLTAGAPGVANTATCGTGATTQTVVS